LGSLSFGTLGGNTYKVAIYVFPGGAGRFDLSDNNFTITAAPAVVPTGPSLKVSVTSDTKSSFANNTNVIAGAQAFTFTKFILSAEASNENISVSYLGPSITTLNTPNTADNLTNCQLYDGSTALNTGGRAINPSDFDAAVVYKKFQFDTPLTIVAGSSKVLSLKCNVDSGSANGQTYGWGLTLSKDVGDTSVVGATGVASGVVLNSSNGLSINQNAGRQVKVGTSGLLSVILDASTLPLRLAKAGNIDENLTILRVSALGESVRLDRLGLQLGKSNLNSPVDLSKVSIWAGPTKVGEAVFIARDYATATLAGVTVPKDGQIFLTITGNLSNIGTGFPGRSGHLVAVDYDANSSSDGINLGLTGVGLTSGVTLSAKGLDTQSTGVRLVKATPVVTKLSTQGVYANSPSQTLYMFKITAPAGTNGVSLYKFSFNTVSSNAADQISNIKVYCYSDASTSVGSCGSLDGSGLLNPGIGVLMSSNGNYSVLFNPASGSFGSIPEAIRIPAGATRYFEVKADLVGVSGSILTRMQGDAAWQKTVCSIGAQSAGVCVEATDKVEEGTFTNIASQINSFSDNKDFIWSDNPFNTAPNVNDYVWMNGFLVPGLSNADTGSIEWLSFGGTPAPPPQPGSGPSITVLSPNGGEQWAAGETRPVTWSTNNLVAGHDYKVQLSLSETNTTTGLPRQDTVGLDRVDPSVGFINWKIPTSLSAGQYLMEVLLADFTLHSEGLVVARDKSNSSFSIVSQPTTLGINPAITRVFPATGGAGTKVTILGTDLSSVTAVEFYSKGQLSGSMPPSSVSSNFVTFAASASLVANLGSSTDQLRVITNCKACGYSNFVDFILIATPTTDTDLELKSVTKGTFHPYGFLLNVCMHGSKSINDLKAASLNLKGFPIHYIVYDSGGQPRPAFDTSASGGIENLKNGSCMSNLGVVIQPVDQPYFDRNPAVTFSLDHNGVIAETNENNNKLTYGNLLILGPPPVASKSLKFIFPAGSENLFTSTRYLFTWTSTGDIPVVDITVSQKDAVGNLLAIPGINPYLAQSTPNDGSEIVTITADYPLQKINIRISEPTGGADRPLDDKEVTIIRGTFKLRLFQNDIQEGTTQSLASVLDNLQALVDEIAAAISGL